MDDDPTFDVVLYLDIGRAKGDAAPDIVIVERFARRFQEWIWPGKRCPRVYYDPRSLAFDAGARAVLPAKAVVIDRMKAPVTSADPTPAAYHRNIQLGIVLSGGTTPSRIATYFESLVEQQSLRPLEIK